MASQIQKFQSRFLDSVRIYARGGRGGNGLPKYGGIGGKGGDIFVVASDKWNLQQLKHKFPKKRFIATRGDCSSRHRILGKTGDDVEVKCPVGVSVVTDTKRVIGDLNVAGDRVLIARGGCGGAPENNFLGQEGQRISVTLDLKLLADVGFVGYPNAGKSTLLKALSKANPKIASYPFTTIKPNIGVMQFKDFRKISLADLPGLIDGAHVNCGMGHKFLKHCIRTRVLLFVVDITGFRLSPDHEHRTAFETVMFLNKELELYDPDLISKPAVLAVNKMDIENWSEEFEELKSNLKRIKDNIENIPSSMRPENFIAFDAIVPISAKTRDNVETLKEKIRTIIDIYNEKKLQAEKHDDHQSGDESKSVIYL